MVPAELWKKYTEHFKYSRPISQQSLSQIHAKNEPPKQTKNVNNSNNTLKTQHTKKT